MTEVVSRAKIVILRGLEDRQEMYQASQWQILRFTQADISVPSFKLETRYC
ncbi:uncharacterized protein METZ01_LOCUS3842 [marine metagenome]|uniref:Uncharacterized protein n=1 Tax=marine metagenome TaxID=408172 RepID=A0A381NB74_9ZZZZ